MLGPTYFGPVLEAQIAFVKKNLLVHMYHVLCIFTDGEIHDFAKVKDLIVDAGSLPLSIIIVGVGNANFKDMEKLDGDEKRLTNSKG